MIFYFLIFKCKMAARLSKALWENNISTFFTQIFPLPKSQMSIAIIMKIKSDQWNSGTVVARWMFWCRAMLATKNKCFKDIFGGFCLCLTWSITFKLYFIFILQY